MGIPPARQVVRARNGNLLQQEPLKKALTHKKAHTLDGAGFWERSAGLNALS